LKYDTTWKVAATIDVYDDGRNYRVNGEADPDKELEFEEIPIKSESKFKHEPSFFSEIAPTLIFTVMSASAFFIWYASTHEDEFNFKRRGGGQLIEKKSKQYLEIAREKFGPNLPPEVIKLAYKLDTTDPQILKREIMQNLTSAEKKEVVKIVREDFPGFNLEEEDTVFGNLFTKKLKGGSRKQKRNRSVKKQRKNAKNRFRV
jgi:hypothetical protein